jgi:hypothetical protein
MTTFDTFISSWGFGNLLDRGADIVAAADRRRDVTGVIRCEETPDR